MPRPIQPSARSTAVTDDSRFAEHSLALAAAVRAHDDLVGLVLLGSASDVAAERRDEWSDHDFFVLTAAGRGEAARADLSWLPAYDRVVLTAREGGLGVVVVYDDGHVMEFAVGDATEMGVVIASTDATVAVDGEAGALAAIVRDAQVRAAAIGGLDPAADVRLVLVKLLIGVGRVRRGESLNGGQFIRTWAVNHLVRAIRGRVPAATSDARDAIDPVRRFERDYPALGAEIAAALAADPERAARRLFDLTRRTLEPGWPDFPTPAANTLATRLGWA